MKSNQTAWDINRLTKTEMKKTLAEIMLGFSWGVLFFSSIVYSLYLFDNIEGEKRSIRQMGFHQEIARVQVESAFTECAVRRIAD